MKPVIASVDELLRDAESREPFTSIDGKSEVAMERVVIGGAPYIVKHLDHRQDWIMRTTGDLCVRPVAVWRLGILDRVPTSIDHTVEAVAWDGHGRGAVLMRDVGAHLLPEGDGTIPLGQHRRFLLHMAELHATFWGWQDEWGLTPLSNRYLCFHPRWLPEIEGGIGGKAAVPTQYVPKGWSRFPDRAPRIAPTVMALHDDLAPLEAALAATPMTFIQGDWKAGNLGSHPDGRTILIDWAVPGIAPPCSEVLWYACLNRARLPESKDATVAAYRSALEGCGIDTQPWWERQVALAALATMVQFGWEKSLGDDDTAREDLSWWEDRALEGTQWLA